MRWFAILKRSMTERLRKAIVQAKQVKMKAAGVSVRPMRFSDFEFIRDLTVKIDGYTVPPLYVLWMLRRFHGEFCLIAEGPRKERLGYMLAMVTGIPSRRVFIWQFASTFHGQRVQTATSFARHVHKLVKKHGIDELVFTAEPRSSGTRSIKRLSRLIFGCTPRAGSRLPKSISPREQEYHILV